MIIFELYYKPLTSEEFDIWIWCYFFRTSKQKIFRCRSSKILIKQKNCGGLVRPWPIFFSEAKFNVLIIISTWELKLPILFKERQRIRHTRVVYIAVNVFNLSHSSCAGSTWKMKIFISTLLLTIAILLHFRGKSTEYNINNYVNMEYNKYQDYKFKNIKLKLKIRNYWWILNYHMLDSKTLWLRICRISQFLIFKVQNVKFFILCSGIIHGSLYFIPRAFLYWVFQFIYSKLSVV